MTGTLALIGIAALSGTAQDDGGAKPSLFQIPKIFRSASRDVERPPAPPEGRFVRRARQLMADAQQLESSGHVAAALDMARRADSVLSTASRTVGVQWPPGQRTPADYVGQLEQRVHASAPEKHQESAPPTQWSLRNTDRLPPGTRPSSATQGRAPAESKSQANGLLLDWGNRNQPTALANDQQEPPEHSKPLDVPIQLLDAGNQPNGSGPNAEDAGIDNLLDQLRSLDTWEVSGKPGVNGPNTVQGESSPAQSPRSRTGLPDAGSWQSDINDQNVGPIPTQVPHTPFDNSNSAPSAPVVQEPPERLTVEETTVPAPAETDVASPVDPFATTDDVETQGVADVEPAGPQPVPLDRAEALHVLATDQTQPQNVAPLSGYSNQSHANPSPVVALPQQTESNLLLTATVQVLATFIGVLLAILVFRAVAIRIWGPGMGILVPVAQTDSGSNETGNSDGADVVPFGAREETDDEGETEVTDPASVPFRLVGSNYEDERLAEEQVERERDEAILKSVFDQNITLIDELQGIKKSA